MHSHQSGPGRAHHLNVDLPCSPQARRARSLARKQRAQERVEARREARASKARALTLVIADEPRVGGDEKRRLSISPIDEADAAPSSDAPRVWLEDEKDEEAGGDMAV